MSEKTWIQEQKENRLFRGSGRGGDASKMLDISPTNRIINADQGRKLTACRFLTSLLEVKCINELADLVEHAQLCVDGKSREQFMKVAIEQWQGKLAAGRKFTIESLA